jgi:succinyl-CoA synthetase alpha subunit
MPILIDKNTKVICQDSTGKDGAFHSEQARGTLPQGLKSSQIQINCVIHILCLCEGRP